MQNNGEHRRLSVVTCPRTGVTVITPHLSVQLSRFALEEAQKDLLARFMCENTITQPVMWFYTPAMYGFAKNFCAAAVVYDCMDELANFRFASPQLPLLERELMHRADVVFTGGYSLYEAKKGFHSNVHLFPSSVDRAHFAKARSFSSEPRDQVGLGRPRLGFYGVIDERIDFPLIAAIADARPNWSLVMVGPFAKVSPEEVPQRPNIHYLGAKSYEALPSYLAGWDVAMMPFAINEATRYISPTKTPEYLAGGRPVVSTPIKDVIRQYGKLKRVRVAQTPAAFIEACEAALDIRSDPNWIDDADRALGKLSWDRTFARMNLLLEEFIKQGKPQSTPIFRKADGASETELHSES